MKEIQNARFWFYWNQTWVKLTLKPGQTVNITTGHVPDDEGWSAEHVQFHHCAGVVWRETVSEGRDCDGFISHYDKCCCHVGMLRGKLVECADSGEKYLVPLWVDVTNAVYDESAEMAGY